MKFESPLCYSSSSFHQKRFKKNDDIRTMNCIAPRTSSNVIVAGDRDEHECSNRRQSRLLRSARLLFEGLQEEELGNSGPTIDSARHIDFPVNCQRRRTSFDTVGTNETSTSGDSREYESVLTATCPSSTSCPVLLVEPESGFQGLQAKDHSPRQARRRMDTRSHIEREIIDNDVHYSAMLQQIRNARLVTSLGVHMVCKEYMDQACKGEVGRRQRRMQ